MKFKENNPNPHIFYESKLHLKSVTLLNTMPFGMYYLLLPMVKSIILTHLSNKNHVHANQHCSRVPPES